MKLTRERIIKSKYLNLLLGAIFAALAIVFFLWGLNMIFFDEGNCLKLVVPFLGMSLCVFFGLSTMLLDY
jgi:hypothetical protein